MANPAGRPPWAAVPHPMIRASKAILLVLIAVIMLYPFLYVVLTSLSTNAGIAANPLFPVDFSLAAYQTILSGGLVSNALLVSIGITVVGTALSVACTATLAYGLTRTREVPGAKVCLYLVFFTMLFSAGIIPNYLLVKSLGLLNSYWSLIIPGLISAFNLVVIRNFFMEIPAELLEAARIDGAGDWTIFWRIVLPLSKAAIAVIALFYAVGYWNSFFNAMLYLTDTGKWPIQLVLNQYILQDTPMTQQLPTAAPPPARSIQMAVVVLAMVPILLLYPFVQRHFTKGVLTGAIKG